MTFGSGRSAPEPSPDPERPREPTDGELVGRLKRGESAAAELLARRHLRACRAVALAILGDIDAANDVAHDAFIAAMTRIDDCRQPNRFRQWLGQIARNRARDERKSVRVRGSVSLEAVTLTSRSSPLHDAALEELRRQLLGALLQLPDEMREAVLLHDLEGWKHREIAEHLKVPPGTVRSHVHHGRRRLRELLGKADREVSQ